MNKEKLVKYLEMKRKDHAWIIELATERKASEEYIRLHFQSILTIDDIWAAISEGEFDEEI